MSAPTVYPLEMPGRAIAQEMLRWIGDTQSALDYDELRREVTGAIYHAARLLPGRYPIIQALGALHEEARDAENAAANARSMWPTVWALPYAAQAMRHSAEAAAITADLITWSIRAREDWRHVEPALM